MMTFSVIATLQENPIQLQKLARGIGWSLDNERVAVIYRSPATSSSTNGCTSSSA
jgi:hypothetical protein